jgi:hypothetical protein
VTNGRIKREIIEGINPKCKGKAILVTGHGGP